MDQAPHGTTPLGEPMTQAWASQKADSPLQWHMHYWLNLDVLAMLCRQDMTLTALRLEMEQEKIEDPSLRTQLQNGRARFQRDNKRACLRYWKRKPRDDEEIQMYWRDLGRMLEDKGPKMRDYLRRMEVRVRNLPRNVNYTRRNDYFNLICRARQKLRQEEEKDADARNRLSIGPNGIHNQGGRGREAIDTNSVDISD